MAEVIDSVDDAWTFDFARNGELITQTLRAKRPDAHIVSPVAIHATIDLVGESHSLLEAIRRSLDFGLDEQVRLPPSAVQRLEVTGPPLVAQVSHNIALEWQVIGSAVAVGTQVGFDFHDREGSTLASFSGATTFGNTGAVGYSVRVKMSDQLIFTFLIPVDISQGVTMNYSATFEGSGVQEVCSDI